MDGDREREIAKLRARLAELEQEPAPEALPAAKSAAGGSAWLAGAGVLALGLVVVAAITGGQPSPPPPKAIDAAPPSPDSEFNQRLAAMTGWNYSETVDPMTDRKTQFACVTSTNEVQLYPPYRPVKAELCIRQSPRYGLDAIVSLRGDGQIICRSYDGCTAKVRFGQGQQQSFSANGAADGSSNVVFMANASRFLTGLKSADVTRVQLTFYEAGDQVIEFNTKGLEWPVVDKAT